jgi:hypothetical protein
MFVGLDVHKKYTEVAIVDDACRGKWQKFLKKNEKNANVLRSHLEYVRDHSGTESYLL